MLMNLQIIHAIRRVRSLLIQQGGAVAVLNTMIRTAKPVSVRFA